MIVTQLERTSPTEKMAYLILCLENCALSIAPERRWSPVFEVLWKVTGDCCWDVWNEEVMECTPSYLLDSQDYAVADFEFLDEERYRKLKELYQGLPSIDTWNRLLRSTALTALLLASETEQDRRRADAEIDSIVTVLQAAKIPLPAVYAYALSTSHSYENDDAPIDGKQLSSILGAR